MGDCVDCGAAVQNKNAAGHYRDRCCACIIAAADTEPDDARPIPGCTCPKCDPA